MPTHMLINNVTSFILLLLLLLKLKVKVRRVLKSDYRDHEESIISSTAYSLFTLSFSNLTHPLSPILNVDRSDWVTKNRLRLESNTLSPKT